MIEEMPDSEPYTPFPSFVDWLSAEFDSRVADQYAALLEQSRSKATQEQLDNALAVATRFAAVDTGAIEGLYTVDRGFTRTIATQAAAWESALQTRGEQVKRAIEDAISAYEFVLNATTHSTPISEMWIRNLHEVVCASQDTYRVYTSNGPEDRALARGAYKLLPNSPTSASTGKVHAYASVADTGPEMARLVVELRSEEFRAAHPVVQAAYAHYAFVCVHPFADGNGRVARALASVFLYRSPGVPLVIFADQRDEYLDALEAADAGDPMPFVVFTEERVLDAVNIVRNSLRAGPSLAKSVAELTEIFGIDAGFAEMVSIASRLRNNIDSELKRQIAALSLPPQVEVGPVHSEAGIADKVPPPEGYSDIGPDGRLMIWARSSWPVKFDIRHGLPIYVKVDPSAVVDFIVPSTDGDRLEVWLREMRPVVTESLKMRISTWVEARLSAVIVDIKKRASS
ncbi:Fic family protein [Isoptericola sp. NPDC057391]|uniref:Fic family protein n=1 Tax=Isoptericola sp. NPDC057391 TaxID=3346117 RepID=UPI0036376F6C